MGSSACSASTNAAVPPCFWAWAITCSAMVVLPEDSGPKISTTRPRGKEQITNATIIETDTVRITVNYNMTSYKCITTSRLELYYIDNYVIDKNADSHV